MNIHIVAGGPEGYIPDLSKWEEASCIWIGVDRGVVYLINKHIPVHAAFGDFDSITENEWNKVKELSKVIEKFQPEKDETDMELALNWAIEQNPDSIKLFGATGGRMDHTVANLQLLLGNILKKTGIPIEIIDKQNRLRLVKEGTYSIKKEEEYPYISFFPFHTNIVGLTLEGFKYPLLMHNLPIHSTLCVSNELIKETGTFSFQKGILMLIRSHD